MSELALMQNVEESGGAALGASAGNGVLAALRGVGAQAGGGAGARRCTI